jgi:hypothetical protein
MPKRKSLILLFLGLVTSSTALCVFILIYLVDLVAKIRAVKLFNKSLILLASFLFGLLVLALIYYYAEFISVFSELASRLSPGQDGRLLQGDSRTVSFLRSFDQLNIQTLLFGTKECFESHDLCYSLDLEGGGSPLFPIVTRGFLSQFPYYYILSFYIFKAFQHFHPIIYLATSAVFLQRPYVMAFGYSVWAAIMFFIPLKKQA